MRFKLIAALIACSIATPALAQQVTQQNPVYVPMYNTSNTAPVYYQQTPSGAVPVYNNVANTPTLPLNQMVAGKNAPSYVSRQNQIQPYGMNQGGNWYGGAGAMSPQQEAQLQAQIQANQQAAAQQAAAAQQQQYMNSLQQQQTVQQIQSLSQNGFPNLGALQGGPFSNQPQGPVKRKVVYRELNNPLREPQRLFNPDQ